MTAKHDDTLPAIEILARLNEDARDGYAAAADLARNPALSKRLFLWSEERNEFCIALRRSPELAGAEPTREGTRLAGAHRLWMGLRHFVGGDDDALLEECLRGETSAIACYEHVLAGGNWTSRATLRARIAAQLSRVRMRAREIETDLITRIGSKDRAATMRLAMVLIDCHNTMAIATVGEGGPWACSLSYVHDGFALYFLSDPTSRHARNLQSDPRVALTINDDDTPWNEIRGLQIEGRAEIVSDLTIRADVVAKLLATFPALHAIQGDARDIAAESTYTLFKIVPSHAWLIDHMSGTHARFELGLAAAEKS